MHFVCIRFLQLKNSHPISFGGASGKFYFDSITYSKVLDSKLKRQSYRKLQGASVLSMINFNQSIVVKSL